MSLQHSPPCAVHPALAARRSQTRSSLPRYSVYRRAPGWAIDAGSSRARRPGGPADAGVRRCDCGASVLCCSSGLLVGSRGCGSKPSASASTPAAPFALRDGHHGLMSCCVGFRRAGNGHVPIHRLPESAS